MEATSHSHHEPAASGGDNVLQLALETPRLPRSRETALRFEVVDSQGRVPKDFEVEHDRQLHLILVRHDLTGFQHLHPELGADAKWSTSVTIDEAGSYRLFAEFKRLGESHSITADLTVGGEPVSRPLPRPQSTVHTGDYEVKLGSESAPAGAYTELRFTVTRDDRQVTLEDYLGAKGHLVALREGDLPYLHVHPLGAGDGDGRDGPAGENVIAFATEFLSAGRYRLFLQFQHGGAVNTAAFTRGVAP